LSKKYRVELCFKLHTVFFLGYRHI
jgi:hypothetical protein